MIKKLLFGLAFALFAQTFYAQDYVLEFDGVDSRVKYDNDATLDIMNGATDYTIEVWVKPTATSIHNKVLVKRWFQYALTMYQDANKRFYFTHYDASGNADVFINTTNDALTIGEWNHIVVINNSTDNTIKLYANGVDVTMDSPTAIPLSSPTGAANFYAGYGGAGTVPFAFIDKIRVKKTAEDITTLQTSITDANYTTDADTAVLMNFDEGTGATTVNEASTVDSNLQCTGGCAEIPVWHLLSTTVSVANNNVIDFTVYPNPATSFVKIQGEDVIKNIVIFDILGKVVFSNVFDTNSTQLNIDTNNLNTGIYLLNIETSKGSGTQKLIIK